MHISKWIRHRYTCVPHPEPSSLLPPHTIPLGPPSVPAPSIQPGLATRFIYDIIHISMPFSQIIPPSPSPAEPPEKPLGCSAAAAKSLQSCPTLCNPIDGSPSGSPVPGILQARTLEWLAISFSNAGKWKVKVKLLSHARLVATPWTAAHLCPWDFPGKNTGVGCHRLLGSCSRSCLIKLRSHHSSLLSYCYPFNLN